MVITMYKVRDSLCSFFLGAAITAIFMVLLLVPPSMYVVWPVDGKLALQNGSQTEASVTMNTSANGHEDGLAELLRTAAMEDNTIIMTFTNEAWTAPGSLLDIFLESFRIGVKTQQLLKHLVIVAVDEMAFERCQQVHPLCYHLAGAGAGKNVSAELSFMSKDYLDIMWMRNRFQAHVLGLGHGFVFTDVDIVWFRNPLLRIPVAADIAMACDRFSGKNPYDLDKAANGGFLYARATTRTAAFFADWYEARTRYPGKHDQFVFDKVKRELATKHDVTVQLVDTTYLSGHCERRKNFHEVCTFHANCLYGVQQKMEELTGILDEWKRFRAEQELLGAKSTALTY